MAEATYNVYKAGLANGDEDWEGGDYRALLLTGSLTFDASHSTVSAVLGANTEASDGSYGRVAFTGKSVTQNDSDDRADLDGDTLDFDTLDNETPTALVVFRHVTDDTDSVPASFHDTNFGVAANGAGYTVEWPNDVIRIS